jgi:hypothetical protein
MAGGILPIDLLNHSGEAGTSGTEILDIGLPVQLDRNADNFYRISTKMKTYMNKMDLIPVRWELNYPKLFKEPDTFANKGVMNLKYEKAIEDYQARCEQLNLAPIKGVRLWTVASLEYSESYDNTFEENSLEKKINEWTGNMKELVKGARSVGLNIDGITNSVAEAGAKAANAMDFNFDQLKQNNRDLLNSVTPIIDLGKNLILHGKQMGLPKIWTGSVFTPSLNVRIKLVSPYGTPESIKKHVLEPLLYILLLAAPTSDDGMTYGEAGYVHVQAYGQAHMNLAFISSVNVSRSGPEITYNKYQQPLSVDVQLTIQQALNGFASLLNPVLDRQILKVEDMLTDDPHEINDVDGEFAITTTNDIIKSFKKLPGTDIPYLPPFFQQILPPGMDSAMLNDAVDGLNQGLNKAFDSIGGALNNGLSGATTIFS